MFNSQITLCSYNIQLVTSFTVSKSTPYSFRSQKSSSPSCIPQNLPLPLQLPQCNCGQYTQVLTTRNFSVEKDPWTFQWVLRQPRAMRCSIRFVCLGKKERNLLLEKSTCSSSTINKFHQLFHLQYMSLFGKQFSVFLVIHVKLFLFCMSYDDLKDRSFLWWMECVPSGFTGTLTARLGP